MRILDFISQSPPNYIFQKESNKTTLGGTLFLIYAFICIGIFLFYLLDYLNNDKFYIYNILLTIITLLIMKNSRKS